MAPYWSISLCLGSSSPQMLGWVVGGISHRTEGHCCCAKEFPEIIVTMLRAIRRGRIRVGNWKLPMEHPRGRTHLGVLGSLSGLQMGGCSPDTFTERQK